MYGAKTIQVQEANRGLQLRAGTSIASGEWLLFLHADSRLKKKATNKLEKIVKVKSSQRFVWYFTLSIKGRKLSLRILELAVKLRCLLFKTPYGDQGLLIQKKILEMIGGFSSIHIMEDLELIKRIKKETNLKPIGEKIITDGRKWKNKNIIQQALKNINLRRRWEKGEGSERLIKEYYQE